MSRCQHCNNLTHDEHLNVEFDMNDYGKIEELMTLVDFKVAFEYSNQDVPPNEIGKIKLGDIWVHFLAKDKSKG